ncbi:MAG: ABC transporter permease subunit [Haloarculaceae archaeon]
MSWLVVAKKDFRDAARSKLLWVLTALFVLLVGGLAYVYSTTSLGTTPVSGGSGTIGFVVFLASSASLFVSIVALLVGYKAIAGERESGTMSFLLGLPHARWEVVVGKVLGRSAVLGTALLIAFVVAAVLLVALGTAFSALEYVLFVLLTLVFAAAFVAIAVALSSVTGESSRAAAVAIGFWLADRIWSTAMLAVLFVVNGFTLPAPPFPEWYWALSGLGPSAAYSNALAYFLPHDLTRQLHQQVGGLPAWYGLVVIVLWGAVPLVLGVARFRRLDL